jgi:hypothetical protein
MLAAGRQVAHERANAVAAVRQHRDGLGLVDRQALSPQNLAEPAFRLLILALEEAEIPFVAIHGYGFTNDDL